MAGDVVLMAYRFKSMYRLYRMADLWLFYKVRAQWPIRPKLVRTTVPHNRKYKIERFTPAVLSI
jgi:hypothetical protein